jgi:hypothetical protein
MDEITKKTPERCHTPSPNNASSTNVRETTQRSKLLAVVFDGYVKLYADSPLSLHVAIVPRVESAEAERAALELAEARLPLGWQHLTDERLLIGSLSTAVPTLQAMQEAGGLAFGLNSMDEAVRRSVASKRAAKRAAS